MADDYQIVEMPDGTEVEFPASYTSDQIKNVMMLKGRQFFANASKYPPFVLNTQTGVMKPVELNPGQADPISNPPLTRKDIVAGDLPALIGGIVGGFAQTARQRIPAAGILAGGGEAFHQIYQHAMGDPKAPKTSIDAAMRIAEMGGLQALGQGVGEGAVWGMSKVLPHVQEAFMARDMTGSEDALRSFMDPYMNKGLSERMTDKVRGWLPESFNEMFPASPKPGYTIAQKSDPLSGAHRMEQIVESSFLGATPIKQFKFAQQKGISDFADNVSNQIWGGIERVPPSQRGEVFVKAFDDAESIFRGEASKKYAEVDALLGDATSTYPSNKVSNALVDINETSNKIVDLSPFKQWALQETGGNTKFAGYASAQTGDTIIAKAQNLPDRMSFTDAAILRSRIIKEAKNVEGKPVAASDVAKITSRIDSAMEDAAVSVGGDVEKAWRNANAYYKEGKKIFDNRFIENLVKTGKDQPELVGKGLFQNGEITQIRAAKKVLQNDPKTFQAMKAGWLDDVLKKSQNEEGMMVGKSFFSQLKKMGDETLNEIFTKSELALIKRLEEASLRSQKQGKAGGGSLLIMLMQSGPLVKTAQIVGSLGMAGGGAYTDNPEMIAGGLAILMGPRVLANMIVNPKYHSLFYRGLSTEKPLYMPATMKLAAEAYKVEKQLNEKNQ